MSDYDRLIQEGLRHELQESNRIRESEKVNKLYQGNKNLNRSDLIAWLIGTGVLISASYPALKIVFKL